MAAENGDLSSAGAGGPPHDRVPLPLERAILWTPRVSSGRGAAPQAADIYPLFLESEVVSQLMRHLSAGEKEPRFGFLLGRLYVSPASGVAYAVADTAVEAGEALEEEASGAGLIRAWSEAKDAFSAHAGLLLGWYHSHFQLGLMPSGADLDTAARYFDAPWQFSIIVVPDRARPMGGVFRPPSPEAGGGVRPAAFYEILGAPHGGHIGTADSAVSWANYEAHPSGPSTASAPPRRPPESPVQRPPDRPPDRSPERPAERRAKGRARRRASKRQGAAPAEAGQDAEAEGVGPEEAAPPSAGDAEPPPETPVDPTPAAGPEQSAGAERPPVREPPGTGERPIPAWRQVDRRTHPRLTLWEDEEFPPGLVEPPPDVRRPPAGQRAGVPLVIPGEGGQTGLLPPRSRRVAWPVVIAGVLVLGAVLYFLLPRGPDRPTRALDSADETAAPATSVEVRRFLADVDSIGLAAERYAERAADFDAGRIGCELLTTGYVAADDAYVRVATGFRNLGAPSNPRTEAAYQRAGGEMAEVNSHFDRSGCPRP